jgi:hypothetical protein
MSDDDNNITVRLKITSLLAEYKQVRIEARTMLIFEMICILFSILIFISLLTIAVLVNKYILLFMSPIFSVLFILLAMGMFMYSTNLELRASQIEGRLKRLMSEATIQWESIIGIFGGVGQQSNIYATRIVRQWIEISTLIISVSLVPIVFSLWYWFEPFHREYGTDVTLIIIVMDIAVITSGVAIGMRVLYKPAWRK